MPCFKIEFPAEINPAAHHSKLWEENVFTVNVSTLISNWHEQHNYLKGGETRLRQRKDKEENRELRIKSRKQTVHEKRKGRRGHSYWMKAHLFWHSLQHSYTHLDTFKHIDLILICSEQLCSCVHDHAHSSAAVQIHARKHVSAAQGQKNNVS